MIYRDWDLSYIKLKLQMGDDKEDCIDTLIYLLENMEEEKEDIYTDIEEVVDGFVDTAYIKDYLQKVLDRMVN